MRASNLYIKWIEYIIKDNSLNKKGMFVANQLLYYIHKSIYHIKKFAHFYYSIWAVDESNISTSELMSVE